MGGNSGRGHHFGSQLTELEHNLVEIRREHVSVMCL